ncbi:probable serine/threonine-protein kinase PBL3 [Coffea arabica]|uniref:Probable serine/threonine-protein kinase PBL3 n=1 Tax=Coffea arabica TaxID=13443 RepID=A0A6P6UTF8_COFAR|nr:uncharacterized protein LOC113714347 [Coffea arabica]
MMYCFRKVLLELIAGKLGFSADNESAIKDWMESSLSYITSDNKDFVVRILDPPLIVDKHLRMQAWAVALVAKACLSPKPSKRSQMPHVRVALEHVTSPSLGNGNFQPTGHFRPLDPIDDIAKILGRSALIGKTYKATTNRTYLGNNVSRNHEILEPRGINEPCQNPEFLAHPNLTVFSFQELMDATRNSRTMVGATKLWTIYQAWLHEKSTSKSGSGSVIAVRKLYSQNMEVLDLCQSQAHLLGSLSHPNVVEILGYCLKGKELFLVHEFMQHGSLENHLFNRGFFHSVTFLGHKAENFD